MKIKSLILAAALTLVAAAVSCTKETVADTLSVKPSAALTFEASGNTDVTLAVTTTAEKWDFSVPNWVVATKDGNNLVVNVQDNADEKGRVGRITITAGTAEPVRINLHQKGLVAEETPVDGVVVTLNNKVANNQTVFNVASGTAEGSISVSIAEAVAEDIVVEVSLDPRFAEEFSFTQNSNYSAIPAEAVQFASTELTIPAGETESEVVSLTINPSALGFGEGYLVALLAKVRSGAATFATDSKRVNYIVMRANPKEGKVKNYLYFEVNDTNPLNALEYVLEDGTPFFDVVVLFSANINYDSANDVVYLHNNPNVQALLDESEVYLQPLRRAGMKVQLGILGNHDAAGVCQLSDWGAKEYAKEVAQAIKTYKLDGVSLDDEYSQWPDTSNPWFASKSAYAGARLAYELKMAMKEACYWPTEVSGFQYGYFYNLPEIDGHKQSEFIDCMVPNYGSAASTFGDLTKAQVAGHACELNLGSGGFSQAKAESLVNNGYGWTMWFAFDPSGTGNIANNRQRSMGYFQIAAQAFYGQKLLEPKNTYKKVKEGEYDPTPYPIN